MNKGASLPPSLPVYEAPAPRPVAPIPKGIELVKKNFRARVPSIKPKKSKVK